MDEYLVKKKQKFMEQMEACQRKDRLFFAQEVTDAVLDFITIFPFGIPPAAVQAWFPKRLPVSFGVNSYTFEKSKFEQLRKLAGPLPPGYQQVKLDGSTLNLAACQGILNDILFCWESLERFETLGLGYSILSAQAEVVSACYAISYGAQAYHINLSQT